MHLSGVDALHACAVQPITVTTAFSRSSSHPVMASQRDSPPLSSDSENYDANNDSSPATSEPSSSSSPLILYSPPTLWGLLRGAGINLILPFVNGLMLGFGELLAHEVAFRWGWSETKVTIEAVLYLWSSLTGA